MFSEIDNLLLSWLPYIVGLVLAIWLGYELRQAEVDPQWGEESEAPKPAPTKKAKASMSDLIAKEYEKRSS